MQGHCESPMDEDGEEEDEEDEESEEESGEESEEWSAGEETGSERKSARAKPNISSANKNGTLKPEHLKVRASVGPDPSKEQILLMRTRHNVLSATIVLWRWRCGADADSADKLGCRVPCTAFWEEARV